LAQLRFLHVHVITHAAARNRANARTNQRVLEFVALREQACNGSGSRADASAFHRFTRLSFACVWIDRGA
jgi:hypothetical protein